MKKKTEIVSLRKGTSEIELNYADLRKAVLVLRAVNHKLRQRVIDLLVRCFPAPDYSSPCRSRSDRTPG